MSFIYIVNKLIPINTYQEFQWVMRLSVMWVSQG
jgi:hypothetical protein